MSPLPRFQKLPPEKRRLILAAAANEFAEHGFAEASFNRIIAAAGISKGAMYYYFADKADAYAAVLDDVLARACVTVADLPEPTDAESFWSTLSEGLMRLAAEFGADARSAALARDLYRGGATHPSLEQLTAKVRGWVGALVERGQTLGAVRVDLPSDLLADTATGALLAMDRWSVRAMAERETSELLALTPRMFELVRNLVRPA